MTITRPLARAAASAALAAALLLTSAAALPAPARLIAIADVHGAYDDLVAVLQSSEVVNSRLAWTGGAATLVQTGDVVDRGARSKDCLDLLMDLAQQAPRSGGMVVPLIGNHEVMNLIGDLRYVTPDMFATFAGPDAEKRRDQAYKDYLLFLSQHEGHGHAVPPAGSAGRRKWMEEHPLGFVEHREAFGPDGKYGAWIRGNHAVVQIGDGIFVHGGLNPASEFASVAEADERVKADLAAFDAMWRALVEARIVWRYMTFAEAVRFVVEENMWRQGAGRGSGFPARDAAIRLLGYKTWITVSAEGPLWYRGLATEPEGRLRPALEAMLKRLGALYIVAGHSVVADKDVATRFDSRVFLLDTGMQKDSYAGRATALEIKDGNFIVHRTDIGPRFLVPPRRWDGAPPGL